MAEEKDLKTVLKNIKFTDHAKVQEQIVDQLLQVKTRMGRIRRKILVMSGKGGVGKSMVTVNLSLAFARAGNKVGILDVDLNGPCVPGMLGLKGQQFSFTEEGAIPPTGPLGMKIASMEFFWVVSSFFFWWFSFLFPVSVGWGRNLLARMSQGKPAQIYAYHEPRPYRGLISGLARKTSRRLF